MTHKKREREKYKYKLSGKYEAMIAGFRFRTESKENRSKSRVKKV